MTKSYSELSRLPIDFSSTGDNVVVPADAQKNAQVYKLFFVVNAATTIQFKRGSTNLTGPITLVASGSFVLDYDDEPWFESEPGEAFVINQTGTAQVSGVVGFCYR